MISYELDKTMCPFVIIVIMIALMLFIPTSYMMGVTRGVASTKDKKEGAAGGPSVSINTPTTKCGKCQKYKICASSVDMSLGVFCN